MPGFKLETGPTGALDTAAFYTQYTWKVDFNKLKFLYEESTNGARKESLVYLKDATLPAMTVAKEHVMGASLEYKFAKSVAWDDVTLTWYDSVGLLGNIIKWRESVWTASGGLQPASYYKIDTALMCYTDYDIASDDGNDDNSGYTQEYTLIGSWPSAIKHGNLSYTTSDIKVIEITLTYDWAEIKVV